MFGNIVLWLIVVWLVFGTYLVVGSLWPQPTAGRGGRRR
jgi:hypothetical protein